MVTYITEYGGAPYIIVPGFQEQASRAETKPGRNRKR